MRTTRKRRFVLWSAWGIALALLGVAVPKAEAIFKDFGIPLPRITLLLLRISHLSWAWISLALSVLVVDWFMRDAASEEDDPTIWRIWSTLLLAIPLLLIGLVLWALAMPCFNLDHRLSG